MKNAVGYVRCSTDEQGATSIPQQKVEIEKWAQLNQYTVRKWFVDKGKSGTSFEKRPAFCALSREVQSKPDFEHVLVYDESRWGRALNPRESNYWKQHFARSRVKVRIINTSSKNEDDIGSYVMEVVESAEASEFSKRTSRSIRRGMMSPQQGKYSRGGTAPYGYKRVAIDLTTGERKDLRDGLRSVPKQEKVVWDLGSPFEVEVVKRIFELKAQGRGYVAIADIFNAEKVPCPKRSRWKNLDQKWSGNTIRTILRNPTYVGDRVYNRLSFSKFVAREKGIEPLSLGDRPKMINSQSEWVVEKDAHPAIISRETFKEANSGVERPVTKPNNHYYRSSFLLTGLIKCKYCTFNYQGSGHSKSGYRYYVDGGFINKGKSICQWHSIRQDELESFVLKSVRDVLLLPDMRSKIEEELHALCEAESGDQGKRQGEMIDLQIQETEGRLQNMLSLAEKGSGLESVIGRIGKLEEEIKSLNARKGSLPSHVGHGGLSADQIKTAVQRFLDQFEVRFQAAPIIERKELIRKVVEKIVVDREVNTVTCYVRRMPLIGQLEEARETPQQKDWVESVALTGIEPVFRP